mgnify:CR=1 FL=1
MTTPVYIVEGFLGSGKTKLIENSLRLRHCRNVLIFQFEEGEEVLDTKEAESAVGKSGAGIGMSWRHIWKR